MPSACERENAAMAQDEPNCVGGVGGGSNARTPFHQTNLYTSMSTREKLRTK